jgi:hypothetical protein
MKGKTGNSGGEKEPWGAGREIFKFQKCPSNISVNTFPTHLLLEPIS